MAIADRLKDGLPFWPLGLGSFGDEWLCVGISCGAEAFLAVWHTAEVAGECRIPLEGWSRAECLYPPDRPTSLCLSDGQMTLCLAGIKARILRLEV